MKETAESPYMLLTAPVRKSRRHLPPNNDKTIPWREKTTSSPIRNPSRHARRLLRPSANSGLRPQPPALPISQSISTANRLSRPNQHQLQHKKRTHRLLAGRRLALFYDDRYGRPRSRPLPPAQKRATPAKKPSRTTKTPRPIRTRLTLRSRNFNPSINVFPLHSLLKSKKNPVSKLLETGRFLWRYDCSCLLA